MKLTPSSNLGYVAQLRYVQTIHEPPERRNPDNFVRHFFPMMERLRCRFLSGAQLDELRSQPFYYYLLARTQHYDAVFCDAISDKVQYIVNIGCGSDTRAHRFAPALKLNSINVLECDLPEAISIKRKMTRRLESARNIQYVSLDLNDDSWPHFRRWLDRIGKATVMVMMEGVSPYVEATAFDRFMDLLGAALPRDSVVAYDFKFSGVADRFGRANRIETTFRLPNSREEVIAYHQQRGFRLDYMEPGWELEARLLPELASEGRALFLQDGLVRIQVV
jgi:methyltransferase (TIGR00027 family)